MRKDAGVNSGEILEQLSSGNFAAQLQSIETLRARVSDGDIPEDAVIAALEAILRDEKAPAQIKVQIIGLFGKIQGEALLEQVVWARHHVKDFMVRQQAYEVLEQSFQGDAVEREILVLRHHLEPQKRIQAVRALGAHNDERAVPVLRTTLLTDNDVTIRQACAEMLISIQGEKCVSVLTNAIIAGKLSHYWTTSQLRLKRVPFDGAKMTARILQNAPQEVLDEMEAVGRNMRNR